MVLACLKLPWWASWLRNHIADKILALASVFISFSFPLEDCQVLFWNRLWTHTDVYCFKWLLIHPAHSGVLGAEFLSVLCVSSILCLCRLAHQYVSLIGNACQCGNQPFPHKYQLSVPLSLHKNYDHHCLAVLSARYCARYFGTCFCNSHIILFVCLFMTALGVHCYMHVGFALAVASRGYSLVMVCRLLAVLASLVEHWDAWASVVVVHGLSGCGTWS